MQISCKSKFRMHSSQFSSRISCLRSLLLPCSLAVSHRREIRANEESNPRPMPSGLDLLCEMDARGVSSFSVHKRYPLLLPFLPFLLASKMFPRGPIHLCIVCERNDLQNATKRCVVSFSYFMHYLSLSRALFRKPDRWKAREMIELMLSSLWDVPFSKLRSSHFPRHNTSVR